MKQRLKSSKTLKAIVRPLLQKPWEDALMEFRYGLWTGVSPIFGEDGRQLGEGNTRPLIFNRHIPAEVHACKYKGTRYGKEINVSALRVAMNHFYEASAITVAVRDYHMSRLNKPLTELPGIWDEYVISRASLALIAYRYRHDKLSSDEKLPNNLGSQYKLVTGIFVICREMTNVAHPSVRHNTYVPVQELYDYADAAYLFRSSNEMVCAGSTSKIIEFMEFASQGRNHAEGAKLGLDGPDGHLTLLRTLVSDIESWFQYALLTIELDYFIEIEVLRRKIEAEPDEATGLQAVLDLYRAQYAYWLELLGQSEQVGTVSFEQGALDRQNAILAHLNRPIVKTLPEKILKTRLDQ